MGFSHPSMDTWEYTFLVIFKLFFLVLFFHLLQVSICMYSHVHARTHIHVHARACMARAHTLRPQLIYSALVMFAGLGFVTSIVFIFMVGIFFSSWMGASILSIGEWFIKKMPLVRHIYSASKQISAAISPGKYPLAFSFLSNKRKRHILLRKCSVLCFLITMWTDQNSRAFKEVAIIRHPRVGEYVFGFITSSLTLQVK